MRNKLLVPIAIAFAGGGLIMPRPCGAAREHTVLAIPIEGEISKGLVYIVRRGIREAEAGKARAIILKMNTPGGRLDATEDIMDELDHSSVETITYVDRRAFSAGAFIAVATRRIYMAPGGLIGAATPVMLGPGGPQKLSESFEEKITSATRAMIRSAAKRNGHPVKVVEAMVDRDVEIPGVSEKGKLLTLTSEEAAAKGVGLSDGTVPSIGDVLERLGLSDARLVTLEPLWSESLALFLTNSVVSGLLLMLGLLGLYIEFKTPGFGLPGILGIAALALFFWGHRVAGLAEFGEFAVLIVGVLLLAVEIFVIPGFGIVGIAGIAAIFAAIFFSMVRSLPGGPVIPDISRITGPVLSMTIGVLGAFVGALLTIRFLPRTGTRCGIILSADERAAEGYTATSPGSARYEGRTGTAVTMLRPAGKARFGEEILDVVTEGEFLQKGCPIKVIRVEGRRIVVEEAGSYRG